LGVGSRLLPPVLATVALAAGAAGLGGLALWLGLLVVPAAAAAAFVAISDTLEERPALLSAVTSGVALVLVVVASAARQNAPTGGHAPGNRFALFPRAGEHGQEPLVSADGESAASGLRDHHRAVGAGRALSDRELVVRDRGREDAGALHGPSPARGDREVKLD